MKLKTKLCKNKILPWFSTLQLSTQQKNKTSWGWAVPSSAQIELATHKLVVNILPAYGEVDDAGAAYCTPLSLFG